MAMDEGLIGSWELRTDGRDTSGGGRHAAPSGAITFGPSADGSLGRPVARIAGGRGRLEVPDGRGVVLGAGDFTISAWVNLPAGARSGLGDLAALFDPATRRGFTLSIQHGNPCGNHGNDRDLCFAIDAGTEPMWTDHGRPSPPTIMVCAVAAYEGELYAATWEAAPSERGRVYRLNGDGWADCGSPWKANAVSRLAVHRGHLYAGVSRLKGGGSAMPDSANHEPGGRILRYEGGTEWADCGQLAGADSIAGLIPFDGDLYAIPMYSEGVFRMVGRDEWAWCGTPGRRLLALGVHDGSLLGAGNDHADVESAIAQTAAGVVVPARSAEGGGGMFRYDGNQAWTCLGLQQGTTQVYSIETYGGEMYIGTWPNGLVFRNADDGSWQSCGRLGDDTEVMNLIAFAGKLYAGSLPGARVYRFDGPEQWPVVGTLDRTAGVLYRRAASMVVHRGELFVGTLPSGRVHSMRVGLAVSLGRALPTGWHHVAAARAGSTVSLWLDGAPAASASDPDGTILDLGSSSRLVLGGGPRSGLEGEIASVRLYGRALAPGEIAGLASGPL
jgi:hypothetical protein